MKGWAGVELWVLAVGHRPEGTSPAAQMGDARDSSSTSTCSTVSAVSTWPGLPACNQIGPCICQLQLTRYVSVLFVQALGMGASV